MDKRALLAAIVAHLEGQLAALHRSALATFADATDEQNKAENKYDTRGLEASYLARGQSKAVETAAATLAQFRALAAEPFAPDAPIAVGALVTLSESARLTSHYFIGPGAGGTEVQHAGASVLVVTPHSPLGRQLLARRSGDTVRLEQRGRARELRITTVE
ncbi:MAG: hypothetical protein RLZZ15_1611 [Verrucomicrobiota bacterium]|jgi:transcription elongation GreA/GreB family factor